MIFVDNEENYKPYVNLALEEYLLRNFPGEDDILLFYINEHAIIIGKHQNTLEEINQEYVQAHDIHITRRLSGGGAVYHDLGNLNFSFITQNKPENVQNFVKFTQPVVEALKEMGVPAESGGRNDILVDGRKVSGNAQYISRTRMVSHGTLLLNTDLSVLSHALNPKPTKFESKGIKSVRSRVANIREFLSADMDILDFRQRILQHILRAEDGIPQYHLTAADWEAVHKLSVERYQTWDWNYGQSPKFNVQRVQRFSSGEIDARIEVEKGLIHNIRFYGDFFSGRELNELESALMGLRYQEAEVGAKIAGLPIGEYFFGVTPEELLTFLFHA
ncbi:lipoate-protein ligase [Longilinea arvoryzae]|uniref:lipoate--protein ligase n=1 Tax=Longilinea arvoryzae TaxID=360412 RepID=A0A0S7BIB0_9CHLR|nr:lipoate--protein ligase [Longilinea arvoryzae]GAP13322.1 lipoate-protein ligase [Longilinea arvoryzae]